MRKVFIVGLIAGMISTIQPANALEIHPVGMVKAGVKGAVTLVDAGVSKVKGLLTRTVGAARMLVRTAAVTADTAAEGLQGSAETLIGQ